MLKRALDRYLERFSWVNFVLNIFRLAAIVIILFGIYNTVTAAKYTGAQWGTLVFAGLAQPGFWPVRSLPV